MMMKSLQIFWKCYEYGDNLVNVFEFIDDQRSKSVRDITIPDPEVTEEFIDKHGSIVRSEEFFHNFIRSFGAFYMFDATKCANRHFAFSPSPISQCHNIHNSAILTIQCNSHQNTCCRYHRASFSIFTQPSTTALTESIL